MCEIYLALGELSALKADRFSRVRLAAVFGTVYDFA